MKKGVLKRHLVHSVVGQLLMEVETPNSFTTARQVLWL